MKESRSDDNPSMTDASDVSAMRSKLEERLKSITKYLTPLLPLANCHMVEFLTKNHWEKALPDHLRKELEDFDQIWSDDFTFNKFWDFLNTQGKDNTACAKFIQETNHYTLNDIDTDLNKYCISTDQLQDKLVSWGGRARPEINITAFMNKKKSYEVATMSRLVASVYEATSSTCCIEAGGGRGHLVVALTMGYQIPSLTVDCDNFKVGAAEARVKLVQKQWPSIAKTENGNETTALNSRTGDSTDQQDTEIAPTLHTTKSLESTAPCTTSVKSTTPLDTTIRPEPKNPPNTTTPQDAESKNPSEMTPPHDASTSYDPTTPHVAPTAQQPRSLFPLGVSPASLHRFAKMYITKDTDLVSLVEDKFPELVDNVRPLLTGLHTCGDLGPSSLRIFASHPSTAAVFNVPCCYNLLTEGIGNDSGFPMSKYLKGFKLGRNARMLAAQSKERVLKVQKFPPKSLLYRAMLEVLIKNYTFNVRVAEGRLKASECNTFEQYLKMADDILKLNLSKLPRSIITQLCEKMDLQWRRLVTLCLLRLCLAPVVETVILLDRLLFLLEKDYDKVFLVKLFDPVLSPRCHGIVAIKK